MTAEFLGTEQAAALLRAADDWARRAWAGRVRPQDEAAERSAHQDARSAAPKAATLTVARRRAAAVARARAGADPKGSGLAAAQTRESVWPEAEWGAAVPTAAPAEDLADEQQTKPSEVLPEDGSARRVPAWADAVEWRGACYLPRELDLLWQLPAGQQRALPASLHEFQRAGWMKLRPRCASEDRQGALRLAPARG